MENELVYINNKRYPKRRQWSIVGETASLDPKSVFTGITYMHGIRSVGEMTKDLITAELVPRNG